VSISSKEFHINFIEPKWKRRMTNPGEGKAVFSLSSLCLTDVGISSEGVKSIGGMLMVNTNLRALDIGCQKKQN